AFALSETCQVMFVVGTSAIVQPAASLPGAARRAGAKVVEINLEPTPLTPGADFFIPGKAGDILPLIDRRLRENIRAGGRDVPPGP
ncbi:MAG: NAD-dependent protein deacylase, partial [Candidatus Aminicenantales bacterium]